MDFRETGYGLIRAYIEKRATKDASNRAAHHRTAHHRTARPSAAHPSEARPSAAPPNPHPNPYPLRTLFWECTLQCNQYCRHCGSNASSATSKDIPGADFIAVLDLLKRRLEARGWPLPFLAITGGEPLVRKDLSEVMHVAFRELGYTWGMTSNGVALSPGTAARLAQAGMSTVSVSLDGYGATHDTQRNAPGSYETTMANLINMTKNRVFKRIQVTTVVNPHNMDELETLHAVLLPLGLTSWRLASTDPIGRADESLMLTGAQHRELFEFIVSHSDERLPIIYACPSHLGEYEQRVRDHPFHCSAGQETMSILHNGDVAACPNIPAHDDTIQGNIYDQDINLDILEVWDTRYHFHRNRDIMFSEFCDACDVWDACRGGSRHSFDFEARTQRKCIKKMLDFERERGR